MCSLRRARPGAGNIEECGAYTAAISAMTQAILSGAPAA